MSRIDLKEKEKVVNYTNTVIEKPLVSVSVVTYNHEKYIRECIDGLLMQKTDFPFEILLGEDESTDGTREICIEYARKYPKKIRLFLHSRENNIKIGGQPTGRFNFLYNLTHAKGKYIALCEGDDYWTDPLKLQKQVEVLENNINFSICGHYTKYIDCFGNELFVKPIGHSKTIFSIKNALIKSPVHTSSMLFRGNIIEKIMKDIIADLPAGDNIIMLKALAYGNGYCIPEVMSHYRLSDSGIWTSKSFIEKSFGTLQFAYSSKNFVDSVKVLDWLIAVGKASSSFSVTVLSSIYRGQVDSLKNDILSVFKKQRIIPKFKIFIILCYSIFFMPYTVILKLYRRKERKRYKEEMLSDNKYVSFSEK